MWEIVFYLEEGEGGGLQSNAEYEQNDPYEVRNKKSKYEL